MKNWVIASLLLIALLLLPGVTKAEQTLRVYHIGNSVTDTLDYRALAQMAGARSHKHVWGRHMIPGAPLAWIWQHPEDGFREEETGYYPEALTQHAWDAVTLQPFDRLLTGEEGDVKIASQFIETALKNPANRSIQFYIYSRWPRRPTAAGHTEQQPQYEPLDYSSLWERKFTGGWDNTNETRDYFERLLFALQDAHSDLEKPLLLIPVGDVLQELDKRMRAGQIPGFENIEEVYTDGIHFNNVGSFIVGTTFFASLYREDPNGLPGEAYEVTDQALVRAVQSAVWDVVRSHPLAGVGDRP